MLSPVFGEFLGTLILILLGDGVVAAVLLNRSKAQNAGWIVITAGWAFAVFCGVHTAIAFGSPGAHLNPAVTVALAVRSGDFSHVVSFIAAQLLGAFLGASLVWLFYYPHWRETPDPTAKLATFCTIPAIRLPMSNLFCEIVATGVLILVIGAIGAKSLSPTGPAPKLLVHIAAPISC